MKRLLSTAIFVAYSTLLIKVLVFKDLPVIRVGHLMFKFGGANGDHPTNFVPFRTIVPYLFSSQALIAAVNLAGNVALLVPIGFVAPFVFGHMTWKKSLVLAIAAGLGLELLQIAFHVGIFDIDDVILNALGVMVGYVVFAAYAKLTQPAHVDM